MHLIVMHHVGRRVSNNSFNCVFEVHTLPFQESSRTFPTKFNVLGLRDDMRDRLTLIWRGSCVNIYLNETILRGPWCRSQSYFICTFNFCVLSSDSEPTIQLDGT